MNNAPQAWVALNKELVPAEAASLQVNDLALQRGYGIFDYFRVVNQRPVFLDHHLERFRQSAAHMRLPVQQDAPALKALIADLIRQNNIPDAGIRLTLTGGYSPDAYSIASPNLIITQHPLPLPSPEIFRKGIRLVTYAHQRQMPAVKTIDYLMAVWLQPFIQEHGADDVLYQQEEIVTECPRANVFIVTATDTLVTPARNILGGVVRRKVLEVAAGSFAVEERDITVAEVESAKEVFITSTTKLILPVVQVNGHAIGNGRPGPVTARLSNGLLQAVLNA